MSEELLVRYCAPILAAMKTGNVFTCPCVDAAEIRGCIRRWNKLLVKKGLRVLPLRVQNQRALIYVYRPARLARDLRHTAASELLRERGYCVESPESCVLQLVKRLDQYSEFLHEIGLFLGYPPEDVSGFIENKARGCKCVGDWKVYGDEEAARKLFAKFKKCTAVYCAQYAKGRSIERLAVAG